MNEVRHVIVPGSASQLLRRELALAFSQAGARVSLVDPAHLLEPGHPLHLSELLDGEFTLLFSVNFSGLTPLRPVLEILGKGNGTAAVWCVDNPWNILAGVRDPRWKNLLIFVTDASFLGPLGAHGADAVFHLPLAASFELFAPHTARDAAFPPPSDLAPFVFVGRSAFPGKQRFYAGLDLPAGRLAKALDMLAQGLRPDLAWWERELKGEQDQFWPGKRARLPALGAEETNLAWRQQCLEAAAEAGSRMTRERRSACPFSAPPVGLDVFGDDGWRPLLPSGARLHRPVDYYARLPGIYAKARYTLCLTSLQLPQGLNQRHFDVWAAGGLALSDATPGLALFPQELTRPITFRHGGEIAALAEQLEGKGIRKELSEGWRACLREKHTYRHRACDILEKAARAAQSCAGMI